MSDILVFYANPGVRAVRRSERKQIQKIAQDLDELRRTGAK
jgi:hypothetical protein